MTDKEKQIEEMAEMLSMDCGVCEECNCVSSENKDCTDYYYAKKLYNAGYRKIPEGSVIVSKQIWEEHIEKREKANKIFEERVRQETAREFVNLPDSDILVVDTQEYGEIEVVSIERLQELAKQFGVEVER